MAGPVREPKIAEPVCTAAEEVADFVAGGGGGCARGDGAGVNLGDVVADDTGGGGGGGKCGCGGVGGGEGFFCGEGLE